jgi:hypothetical protein
MKEGASAPTSLRKWREHHPVSFADSEFLPIVRCSENAHVPRWPRRLMAVLAEIMREERAGTWGI